jgi:chromosome segregation ATPase
MNKLLASALLAAGIATVGAPLLAQDAPATKARPQAAQRQAGDPAQRVEARLAELKTNLKITDAQLPQWNAFADTVRKQAREGGERMRTHRAAEKGAKSENLTAIQRLEQRQKFMAEASTRLNEVLASARPLYAALSPEQQKIADDLMARQGERRHGGHNRPAKG